MKHQIIFSLIVIAALIQGIKSTSCNFYTDTNGKCVIKCKYPEIGDANTKTCLTNDSSCKTYYFKQENVCLNSCPQYFAGQSVSGKNYQLCVPCNFKDSLGNCYEHCPSSLIQDYTTNTCLSQSSQCQAFFIKDQNSCVKQCPQNYNADTSQTPNVCINCRISGTCTNTNNTGGNSGTGNTNNISCNQYLSANMKQCSSACPPGQIALAQVQGQSYQQCQLCPQSQPYVSYDGTTCVNQCNTGEIINQSTLNCIQPSQCTLLVYTNSNNIAFCVDQCPTNLQQLAASNGQSYGTCQACPSGQYLNPSTQQCVASCQIVDASGKICLSSIKQCIGYISVDQTQCQASCPSGQYIQKGKIDGQFQCLASCSATQYVLQQTINNVVQNYCVNNCPQYFYPGANNICTSVSSCTNYLSMDGKTCLTSCPSGQIPTKVPNQKIQQCKPCFSKVSSDSKSCVSACSSGQIYDVQSKQCENSSACTGIQTNGLCLAQCQPGQLLSVDSNNNKSCISLSNCTSYVSVDKKSCLSSCPAGQGVTTKGSQNFCVLCKYGLASDGVSCLTSCPSGQIYNISTKACIASSSCSGMISANGKRCVASCEYPEVKPSSTSTQCAYQCQSGQLYQDGVGCIAASNCTGYQSANGVFCVQSCAALNQIVSNSTSTPKTCSKCPDGQYPQVQSNNQIQCVIKSSDISQSLSDQASSVQATVTTEVNLTPSQKTAIKDQFADMVSDLEQSITAAQNNSTLSASDLQSLIQSNLQTLKSQVLNYLNSVSSYDNSTNSDHNQDQVPDQNQVVLGTNVTQVISEKIKKGFSFKLSFNLTDLISNSFTSLQQDNSQVQLSSNTSTNTSVSSTSNQNSTNLINSSSNSLDIGNANGQTDFSIQNMHFIYISTNPYCSGSNCVSGQAIIDTSGGSGRLRNLQSSSATTYQLTYNVNPSQIQQTICVSYDSNGLMTLNPTSINMSTNQITCTFSSNSSLYYDSTCQYVSSSLCSASSSSSSGSNNSTSTFTAATTVTQSLILITKLIFSLVVCLFI
ncbi:hypothetical protein ABPG74_010211 [Tetrahymena malaccensis]